MKEKGFDLLAGTQGRKAESQAAFGT